MTEFEGKTVFLTGGTGFVGSHLAEALVRAGARVRCLVRAAPKWLDGVGVEIVQGGLLDSEALAAGVQGADHVFHIAGRTRGLTWEEFERDNVEGTLLLMRAVESAGHAKRVTVTSSLAAVGASNEAIANEDVPLRPVSQYGRSKAVMEERLAEEFADLPITVIRPPAVYGPREADIFTFFQTVSRGLCPIVGSPSEKVLSLVHSTDLVQGIMLAASHEAASGRTYFMGGPTQVSWAEVRNAASSALKRRVLTIPVPKMIVPAVGAISEVVGRLFGTYPPLNREKAREILEAALMCDHSRAQNELGYAPSTRLDAGVAETIAWYQQKGWL